MIIYSDTSGSLVSVLNIATNMVRFIGQNMGVDGKDYTSSVSGIITDYGCPTIVYDYVWKGGNTYTGGYDENSWTLGSKWESPCGVEKVWANYPGESFNCLIPSGLTYYPTNFINY